MKAKTYSPALGLTILFNRFTTTEVTLPSGRKVKDHFPSPAVLRVEHGDSSTYFERTRTGQWTAMLDEDVLSVVEVFDSAEPSKRAPDLG